MRGSLQVVLPRLHPKQSEIRSSPARRKVICAGRRAGKTTLAACVAVEKMLQGHRVLYATPTQEQADAFWELVKGYVLPLTSSGHMYKNENEHILELEGARIRAKTAWDADSLRGDYADLLIMDEAAMMKADAWDKVGAPMLLDNDGEAWFISTPMTRNHFYQKYIRAKNDGKRWKAWHFTSHDNPYLSKDALNEIAGDQTERGYKQEILAEFLENEGAVFRNLESVMHAPRTTPEEHEGHLLAMGIDWGQIDDYSAWSIGCKDCQHEVAHDRFRRMDYTRQRARVVGAAQKWAIKRMVPEENSIGKPIIAEMMRDRGLDGIVIEPFVTSTASKPALIQGLELAVETGEFQWLADSTWTSEMEAYEVNYGANTQYPRYSAPERGHDDTVMARALMWRALTQARTFKFAAL